jgi:hypothetical protein
MSTSPIETSVQVLGSGSDNVPASIEDLNSLIRTVGRNERTKSRLTNSDNKVAA